MSLSTVFFAERFWCPLEIGDRVARLTPSGELDISTAPMFSEALRHAQAHADLIVLDLAQLEFMDASGARLLADASRRARWNGGRMLLQAVPDRVDRLLRLVATT
ncbi:MAG: STAS domain-containing protein [Actinomycetota bacterium]|nr:STAS domain-containing protein [Actinomycetota bacterium]